MPSHHAPTVTAELSLLSDVFAPLLDSREELIQLVSITGHEGISELFAFRFEVLFHPLLVERARDDLEQALLMSEVAFRLGPHGDQRRGMINEVRFGGHRSVGEERYTQLVLSVVPRAWLLTQRRNSRIFQHKYVDEIVSAILVESGIRHRWDLRNTYPKRIYCTQYEETDYDFICRLFAEEGIYFYFAFPEAFRGGDAASHEPTPTEADKNEEAVRQALTVARSAAKELESATKSTGDEGWEGAAGIAGGAIGMTAHLLKEQVNDEDDHPMVLGSGEAGREGSGDVLVFCDQAGGYAYSTSDDHGGDLVVHLRSDAEMSGGHDEVHELTAAWRTAPIHAEVRDYDFRRPLLALEARVGEEREDRHSPGRSLEIYEHHGQYLTQDVTPEAAQLLLEQSRRNAALGRGRGACPRLCAGHVFRLDQSRSPRGESALPDGRYGICRVEHEYYNPHLVGAEGEHQALIRGVAHAIHEALIAGRALPEEQLRATIQTLASVSASTSRAYNNRFVCLSADVAHRPERPARIARHVTETATVMGPEGQDIYLDRHGRVKVQFHWDRQGEFNEHSSCWLRVAQPWAGAGYGFQFLPRCGMEVLVSFIGGDTDRPIVVGALYNGTHATPEPLPYRSTRSGIRTQTSPNGGGFNELSFEDAKNNERIFVHAQRNLEEIVNFDRDTTIGHSERTRIGGDQQAGISGNQQLSVGKDQAALVGGNQSSFVGGNQSTRVAANKLDMVDGSSNVRIGGASVRSVQFCDIQSIRGPRDVNTMGHAALHVGKITDDETGHATAYVQGGAYLTAKRRVVVRIQEDAEPAGIRLECGTSVIEILPDRVTIDADKIMIRARDTFEQVSSGARVELSDNIAANGKEITLVNDDQAALLLVGQKAALTAQTTDIHGGSISMRPTPLPGTRPSSQQDREDVPTKNVKLRFTHLASDHGEPIANTKYRATSGELVLEGSTDGDGVASLDIPEEVSTVDIVLYANQSYSDIYPEDDGPLRWAVGCMPSLLPADDLRGARVRLMNLGYAIGQGDLISQRMDDATEQALLDFQYDHHIPATGALDDATKDKLVEVYGD